MKRSLIAGAACALAVSFAFSTSANAVTRAPIRTYTESSTIALKGAGFLSSFEGGETVALSPRLAFECTALNETNLHGKILAKSDVQGRIVGNREYTKQSNGSWRSHVLSPAGLRQWRANLDPYAGVADFDALRGVHRISATQYRVSGSLTAMDRFMVSEFNLPAKAFENTGITALTLSMTTDASGRPVRFTASGKSAAYTFSDTEYFRNYNKPLAVITAP